MSLQAVRIRHMSLHGQAGEQAGVQAGLERSAWPGEGACEYLMFRRLAVRGTAAEIGPRAAFQAQRLAMTAVDGWSPGADAAMAVRFASHPELMACLLRDILAGRASLLWYWRTWKALWVLPAAAAAARLLAGEPLSIPFLLARLEPVSLQHAFWHGLSVDGAVLILEAITRATGWATSQPAGPVCGRKAGLPEGSE